MIYQFLKRSIKFAFFIFYRKKVVSGLENISSSGPLIIAVNHPNTLLDPLLIATQVKRKVGFLANASIFRNKIVSSIFNYFQVIPVYRKKDIKPGEIQDNSQNFRKCYEFFDNNGALLIFPEGTSVNELKLRDIKTGTARIALAYEADRGFPGTLNINTITLNYSDSLSFRSMVSVNVNPSFKVKEYQNLWEEDSLEAVKSFTKRIQKEMEGQITLTNDKNQEKAVLQVQKFYTEYIDPSISRYTDPTRSFEFRRKLAESVRDLQNTDPLLYHNLETQFDNFFNKLDDLKITPGFVRSSFLEKNKSIVLMAYIFQLALLFPFYIIGLITNYIPYKVPLWIFKALKPDIEYRASIHMISGMIVFPLFYLVNIILFHKYISSEFVWSILFLFSLPFLGFIVLFYWKIIKRFLRVLKFYFSIKKTDKEKLIKLRNSLSEQIRNI